MRKTFLVAAVAAAMTSSIAFSQESSNYQNFMEPANKVVAAKKDGKTTKKDAAKSAASDAAMMAANSSRDGRGSPAMTTGLNHGKKAKAEAKAAKQGSAKAAKVEKKQVAKTAATSLKKGRKVVDLGAPTIDPGVDMMQTSSVAAARPKLVAKERNASTAKAKTSGKVAKGSAKGPYGAIIARYAATYGVPVSLAHAVIRVESNYRVNARGAAGEVGLMQIKPATARGLGYSGSTAGLFNPETNIRYGMKYLGMAHKLGGGSTCGTILKYNAGHGAKRMNPISANYCAKVKRHMGA